MTTEKQLNRKGESRLDADVERDQQKKSKAERKRLQAEEEKRRKEATEVSEPAPTPEAPALVILPEGSERNNHILAALGILDGAFDEATKDATLAEMAAYGLMSREEIQAKVDALSAPEPVVEPVKVKAEKVRIPCTVAGCKRTFASPNMLEAHLAKDHAPKAEPAPIAEPKPAVVVEATVVVEVPVTPAAEPEPAAPVAPVKEDPIALVHKHLDVVHNEWALAVAAKAQLEKDLLVWWDEVYLPVFSPLYALADEVKRTRKETDDLKEMAKIPGLGIYYENARKANAAAKQLLDEQTAKVEELRKTREFDLYMNWLHLNERKSSTPTAPKKADPAPVAPARQLLHATDGEVKKFLAGGFSFTNAKGEQVGSFRGKAGYAKSILIHKGGLVDPAKFRKQVVDNIDAYATEVLGIEFSASQLNELATACILQAQLDYTADPVPAK